MQWEHFLYLCSDSVKKNIRVAQLAVDEALDLAKNLLLDGDL